MLNPLDAQDPHPFHDDELLGDTPIGTLRLARQPGGYLGIERLDPFDPTQSRTFRGPDRVHELRNVVFALGAKWQPKHDVLGVVYGARPLECEGFARMHDANEELRKAQRASYEEALRDDEAKEWQRMLRKDQDVAALLRGDRVRIVS